MFIVIFTRVALHRGAARVVFFLFIRHRQMHNLGCRTAGRIGMMCAMGRAAMTGLQKDARFMKLKEETSMPDGMIQQDPGTGGTIFRGMLTRGRIGQR
jgi:hypothetical protein